MSWNPEDLSGFGLPGYRLIRQLGQGGMATVYLALQESVDREVALKVMSPFLASDSSFTDRFLREARIAAQLHHPHIVTVHDVGVHDAYHYIAMQYLSGGKLSDLDMQQLTVERTLEIIRDIGEALSYAHEKGFVHRDVKPDNILFDEKGASFLTDFGIARAADSNTQMTATGSIIGTPHYMSPEQARGRKVDQRADLYSLGIVLYELLLGEVPYQAEESLTVCIMHVNDPVPRLPQCLEPLQPILERLLAKDPADRFEHANQFLQTLDQLRQDGKLDACLNFTPATLPHIVENTTRKNTPEIRPTPRPNNGRESTETRREIEPVAGAKRHSVLVWIVLFTLLLGSLMGGGWYVYQHMQAERERVKAEARLQQQLARLYWLAEQGQYVRPAGDNVRDLLLQLQHDWPDNPALREAGKKVLHQWLKVLEQHPSVAELQDWQRLEKKMGWLDDSSKTNLQTMRLERMLQEKTQGNSQPEQQSEAVEAQRLSQQDQGWLEQMESLVQSTDFNQQLRAWVSLQQTPPSVSVEQRDALRRQVVDRLRQQLQQLLQGNEIQTLNLRLSRLVELPELFQRLDGAWWQQQVDERQQMSEEKDLLSDRIRQLLDEGQSFLSTLQLTRPEGANAQDRFETVLALDPDNKKAIKGLNDILAKLLELAEKSLEDQDFARASRYLNSARGLHVENEKLVQLEKQLQQAQQKPKQAGKQNTPQEVVELPEKLPALLAFADENKRKHPDLAIQAWRKVLLIEPGNPDAQNALSRTAQALALDAEFLLEEGNLDEARTRMQWAMLADPEHPDVKAIRRKFKRAEHQTTQHKGPGLERLKTAAQEQRLLIQAQAVQAVEEAEGLWQEAEALADNPQAKQQIQAALLRTAQQQALDSLQKGLFAECDLWLKWLETKPGGIPLAAPIRLQWRELQSSDSVSGSDAGL